MGVRLPVVPDTVSLIIWLIGGAAGGFAVRNLLRWDSGLDPFQIAGVVGGVIGVQILQRVIPGLGGLDILPIVGQAIVAFASGAALTVVAGAVIRWRRR